MMRSYKKQLAVFVGCCAVIGLTATLVPAAKPTPPPPPPPPVIPPPLTQIVAPDMNKLGLLDCLGNGTTRTTTTFFGTTITTINATNLTYSGCLAYLGFPITKVVNITAGFKPAGPFAGFPNDPAHPRNKLVALGKALFWDMQVGSDGIQACATCHYHAGADNRYQNQTTPASDRIAGKQLAVKQAINVNGFGLSANADSTLTLAPNGVLKPADFPVPFSASNKSAPDFGNNDTRSSQGVHGGSFTGPTDPVSRVDASTSNSSVPLFDSAGVRRVEPRHTPSMHAAVYNLRQFWDGRANLFFNGVNPFGMLDPDVRVKVVKAVTTLSPTSCSPGCLDNQQLMIPYSSLASQAVGPPLSGFEMSFVGRSFQDLGHKLLALKPLARQQVSATDSVLGPYADTSGAGGLTVSYAGLIKDVFQEKFWKVDTNGTDLSLMEQNFALFFGLAIQAYEATLIPDQTEFDGLLTVFNQGQNGTPNPNSLNPTERGLAVFLSVQAKCAICHVGGETTGAAVGQLTGFGRPALPAGAVVEPPAVTERMVMGDGVTALYDTGFYNVGIRPTADDLGIFGRKNNTTLEAFLSGVPFSFGMLQQDIYRGSQPNIAALLAATPAKLQLPTSPANLAGQRFSITVGCMPIAPALTCTVTPITAGEPTAIRGAFKAPSLRNSVFTGPYFHTGAMKNLSEVLSFYNLGGRFNLSFDPDNCGKTSTATCLKGQVDFDPAVVVLGLTSGQLADLKYLLEVGMVDSRVSQESLPFDHPQICVPHGQAAGGADILIDIPAIGAEGHVNPILTFEQTMTTGVTGYHDHNLATACLMSPLPNVP